MWHFNTQVGTIWIIDETDRFYLGINNDALGTYECPEEAVLDVNNHTTGYPDWDARDKMRVPQELSGWISGEPGSW